MATTRKPKYFLLAFGKSYAEKHPVEGGVYPHRKGYISSSGISAGDVMLLHCCDGYPGHDQEAPGLGVVTSIDSAEVTIYYQYFPLNRPVEWETIKNIPELAVKGRTNFSRAGNWLRKIDKTSFCNASANRQIDWP